MTARPESDDHRVTAAKIIARAGRPRPGMWANMPWFPDRALVVAAVSVLVVIVALGTLQACGIIPQATPAAAAVGALSVPPAPWAVLELDEKRHAGRFWWSAAEPELRGTYVLFVTPDGQRLFIEARNAGIFPPEWTARP